MEKECKNGLEELKENYKKLQEKYPLPNFKDLNENFDINKLSEIETDTLLRDIRKAVMDKILAYLRFVELLLNPSEGSLFFFSLVKGLGSDDKKTAEGIFNELGEIEIEAISLDNIYSEKKEAEFIKEIHKKWQEIKEKVESLSDSLKKGWKRKINQREKSYLG